MMYSLYAILGKYQQRFLVRPLYTIKAQISQKIDVPVSSFRGKVYYYINCFSDGALNIVLQMELIVLFWETFLFDAMSVGHIRCISVFYISLGKAFVSHPV